MLPHIEQILDAARSAPSRDNLQPWRFVIEGDTISFVVAEERDRSPMNAAQRMAGIAIGAALESALTRAARMGARVRFEDPRHGAIITIGVSAPKHDPDADKARLRRATNRRLYDARALDEATVAALRLAAPAIDSAQAQWFGRERVRVIGPLVEEAETVYYANPRIRAAALSGMRFDARDREEVTYGLSLGSLELSTPERALIDDLRRMPADAAGAVAPFKKMGARARRLVESASGVCVVTTRGTDPLSDVGVGRVMQRAWLELTRRGMVAQPMCAVPAMDGMIEIDQASGSPEWLASASSAVAAFRAAFPGIERAARIALVMRIGWAAAPTTRVGRRPLDECVDER